MELLSDDIRGIDMIRKVNEVVEWINEREAAYLRAEELIRENLAKQGGKSAVIKPHGYKVV